MIIHARLVISGNVQDVGYRTLIRKVANKLKVNGIARNLDDGDVEVYCQCPDKESLTKFCKAIEIKSSTDDMFVLNVEKVVVHVEGSKDYIDPKTDFKTFKIDYGMELDPFQKATLTRSEVGVLLLGGTRSDIQAMHTDLKDGFDRVEGAVFNMHTDLKEGFKETKDGLNRVEKRVERVEGAVSSMHTDINTRFDTLDTKYGEFGKDMKSLTGDISDLKLLASEFREFKDLFAIYVRHQLDKDSQ